MILVVAVLDVNVVCKKDPFCCLKQWDRICELEATDLCLCDDTIPPYGTSGPNLFFTISNNDLSVFDDSVGGVYAAAMDGGGSPLKLFESERKFWGKMTGITASFCGGLNRIYWGTPGFQDVYYGNLDGSGSPVPLYEDITRQFNDEEMGVILDVAVNEDSGEILLGTENGLYLLALDGTSAYSTRLDDGKTPVVEIDPVSRYAYYGGKDATSGRNVVKLIRPAYGSEVPRTMYSSLMDDPVDIAIDSDSGYLYVVDNINGLFRGLLDGTSPLLEVHFEQEVFEKNEEDDSSRVRTIDVYKGKLFIGVFGNGHDYTTIWTANADGSGTPEVLYNITVPNGDWGNKGIRGLVVRDLQDCPILCDSFKSETTPIFPLSTSTGIPACALTLRFFFNVGWPRDKMDAVTLNIQQNTGTNDEPVWGPTTATPVDVDSWLDGTYVVLKDFSTLSYGTYRWSVSVSILDDPCLEEDVTPWEQFELVA